MVTLFILLIIAVGIMGVLGYTVFSFQQTADIAAQSQRNAARVEAIASIIRGHSRPLEAGGAIRVPAGDLAEIHDGGPQRTVLPVKLVGDDRTPWGARYGYCPTAIDPEPINFNSENNDHIRGGADYGVVTQESAGTKYVVDGALPVADTDGWPEGLLGFVVSPGVKSYDIPYCSEISFRDGVFVISGPDSNGDGQPEEPTVRGTVYPIIVGTSQLALMSSDLDPTLFVAPDVEQDAPATGATVDDPMLWDDAVAFWKANRPAALTLRLADGTYAIDNTAFLSEESDTTLSQARYLRITDASPNDSTGAVLESSVIDLPVNITTDLELDIIGVTLGTGVGLRTLPNARMTILNSTLSQLRVDGGTVLLGTDSSIDHADPWDAEGSPIEVTAGDLTIADRIGSSGLHITSTFTTPKTALRIRGGNVTIAGDISAPDTPLPWSVDGTGRLQMGRLLDGNTLPSIAYDGMSTGVQIPLEETIEVTTGENTLTLIASCTDLRPYMTQPTCSSSGGALAGWSISPDPSDNKIEQLTCSWSDATQDIQLPSEGEPVYVEWQMPAPTSSTASGICTAAPNR